MCLIASGLCLYFAQQLRATSALIKPRGRRASGWSRPCLVSSSHSMRRGGSHGAHGCHGSDDTVSDSVLSLSVFMSLLYVRAHARRRLHRSLVVGTITAESAAKRGSSRLPCVSLNGPGVTLIDYVAGSSTACLAVCPHPAPQPSSPGGLLSQE